MAGGGGALFFAPRGAPAASKPATHPPSCRCRCARHEFWRVPVRQPGSLSSPPAPFLRSARSRRFPEKPLRRSHPSPEPRLLVFARDLLIHRGRTLFLRPLQPPARHVSALPDLNPSHPLPTL